MSATFDTTLWASGPNTTGIQVPEEVVSGLGRGKRVPVVVTINGDYRYRSTIAVMGGQYLVSVSAAHRTGAGIAAGDPIQVTLEVDDAPREVVVPSELVAALAADGAASAAWEKLSYSLKRQHALAVDGAKAAETKARRVTKIIHGLRSGSGT